MTNTSRNRGIGIVTASDSQERSKGQLHIYDGEGKGKSQAALGVVLRTIGLGICEKRQSRVLLLRFLKGPERPYDEDSAIEALQRGFPHLIDHVRTGRSEFFTADQVTKFDVGEAERGWNIAKGAIASSLYSVVVLDELNPVLDLGMLDINEVVDALQAIGKGISQDKSHRVLILQWLKGGNGYTEDAAIEALRESYPHLVDHLRSGRDAIVWRGQQQPIDYVEAERAWEIAKAAILSGLYKTIILDELNPTVDLELLPVESIHQTLLKKPADTEVVITGRCKNEPSYFELADVYSEMVCHKHYANVGVDLKRGVDY